MTLLRVRVILLAPLTLVALAACGGSSQTLTQPQFTSKVNDICTKASQSSAAVPEPSVSSSVISPAQSDLPAISAYFAKEVAVLQSTKNQLTALGTPPSKQQAWTQSLAAIQRSIDDTKAAQSSAQSGNVSAYDQALGRVVEDGGTLDKAFGSFGAVQCTSTASGSASPSP